MADVALKIEKFQSPGKGNGLRATKLVSPGDLLYTEEPFAYAIHQASWGNVCEFCLEEPVNLLQCSRCKFAKYCGKRCQTEAWPDHKTECKCIKSLESKQDIHPVRLVGRFVLKLLQKQPSHTEDLYSVSELVSNYNNQNIERKIMFEYYAEILSLFLKNEIPDLSQLAASLDLPENIAKVYSNRFMILNNTLTHAADGLYPAMSLLNHSCDPNCITFFKGQLLNIRAVKEIQVGEEITITYINPLKPSEERQSELKGKYCFECDCHRCLMREMDDKMLAGDKQASDETKDLVPKVQKLQAQEKWGESLALCKAQLKKNGSRLPDENIYQLQILSAATDACMALSMSKEMLLYGLRILRPNRLYNPGLSLIKAFALRKVGIVQVYGGNRTEGLQNLREAIHILKVVFGKDHSDTQKFMQILQTLQ